MIMSVCNGTSPGDSPSSPPSPYFVFFTSSSSFPLLHFPVPCSNIITFIYLSFAISLSSVSPVGSFSSLNSRYYFPITPFIPLPVYPHHFPLHSFSSFHISFITLLPPYNFLPSSHPSPSLHSVLRPSLSSTTLFPPSPLPFLQSVHHKDDLEVKGVYSKRKNKAGGKKVTKP